MDNWATLSVVLVVLYDAWNGSGSWWNAMNSMFQVTLSVI